MRGLCSCATVHLSVMFSVYKSEIRTEKNRLRRVLFFPDMHKKLMKRQHVHQENKKQGQPWLSNGFLPAPVIKCITEKEDWTSMTEHEIMYEQSRGVWHRYNLLRERKSANSSEWHWGEEWGHGGEPNDPTRGWCWGHSQDHGSYMWVSADAWFMF